MSEGQYNLTAITLPDKGWATLQLNASGYLLTAGGGSGASADQVQGNVAAGATDAGNPVKIGGVYNSSLPTYTTGKRGDWQLTAKGAGIVTPYTAAGVEIPFPAALGAGNGFKVEPSAGLGAKTTANSASVANSALTCAAGGDGSVGNSAETITVANTVQLVEFFNLSANPIWASWVGTAAANTTGSFPIPPLASNTAGFYSAPPGASGSLSIIAPAGASSFTCNLWS